VACTDASSDAAAAVAAIQHADAVYAVAAAAAASRSRHFLRRYWALKQRIAEGECTLRYVPDEKMPADFLTKWIGGKKLETSLHYATNSFNRRSAP